MLAEQRQREILQRLDTAGTVRVLDLATSLAVTEETIRRDLWKLHRQGQLRRTHGGAVRRESRILELPFDVRRRQNQPEKVAIAERAVELVQHDDVIVVDASTTALEFIQRLPNEPLTLLTNSMAAGQALVDRSQIRVIVVGGELDHTSWSLTGVVARQALERFHVSKFFFSCRGVDFERGLSEASDRHAQFKQDCLELSDQAFLLADHGKFGVRSKVFFGGVSQLAAVVTDRGTDPKFVEQFAAAGIEVILSEPAPAVLEK